MSERNTFIRSLHDLGLAAWFGGNLMGAVGLNGAAATSDDPRERLEIASRGWAKWSPIVSGAMIIHGVGGLGLIGANKGRLLTQPGSRANTIVKSVLTLGAVGTSLYNGILGRKMAEHADEGTQGVTEPSASASSELASAQKQQRVLQWITPALLAVVVVLAAQQGEQQRPVAGLLRNKAKALIGR
jgi:hypothetical protein